ncbi:hypothetical protein H8356DRAFT_996799 [Neocallimastix lanati (nom. inval.)]|uniref:Extracellular membrane protein CFEM domain-containing protein n=1 Tax=Neocallimastix californiae TaxID=1754190 RepID=A0A1Y2DI84_9FUNG|nr:hypothetical protein H8356DRAFT_996799 [Neocallimastix sp. JGI-2020a]ORY58949.1 hypothetical protein LY90DRAFT_247773 [Neocallimastix californiae]|eukprot:ORY58949.1 hypothetical protein LY90DRAFT_247773 [Neocallimastix californiae]
MNYIKFFSIHTFLIILLLCSKCYTSCTNPEIFQNCINQVFDNPTDICYHQNCLDIINGSVSCSEPIFDIYKASLTLYCARDTNGDFCPYHSAIEKTYEYDNIYEALKNELALKEKVKDTCYIEKCKSILFTNIKAIILNSILLGDSHYEDINSNDLYNEFTSLCK